MNLMQLVKAWQQNVDQHICKITDFGVKSIENIPQCFYVSMITYSCQSLKPYLFVLCASISLINIIQLCECYHTVESGSMRNSVWSHCRYLCFCGIGYSGSQLTSMIETTALRMVIPENPKSWPPIFAPDR